MHVSMNRLLDLGFPPNLSDPPSQSLKSSADLYLLAVCAFYILFYFVIVQGQDYLAWSLLHLLLLLVGDLEGVLVVDEVIVLLSLLVLLTGLVLALDWRDIVIERLVNNTIHSGSLNWRIPHSLILQLLLIPSLHLPPLSLLLRRNS